MTRVDVEDIPERLAHPIPEAARLLGVSESTVKRLIASGRLKVATVGAHRRVLRSSMYDLLDIPQDAREAL